MREIISGPIPPQEECQGAGDSGHGEHVAGQVEVECYTQDVSCVVVQYALPYWYRSRHEHFGQ